MKAKLLYIGKRLVGGQLRNTFLYRGKELYWRRVRDVQIGYFYPSEIGPAGHTMSSRPERLEWGGRTSEENERWAALELAAEGAVRKARAERLDKKDRVAAALLEKLEPLRETISAMSYSEKRGFFEFILDEFTITHIPSTRAIRKKNMEFKRENGSLRRALSRALREEEKRKRKAGKK